MIRGFSHLCEPVARALPAARPVSRADAEGQLRAMAGHDGDVTAAARPGRAMAGEVPT